MNFDNYRDNVEACGVFVNEAENHMDDAHASGRMVEECPRWFAGLMTAQSDLTWADAYCTEAASFVDGRAFAEGEGGGFGQEEREEARRRVRSVNLNLHDYITHMHMLNGRMAGERERFVRSCLRPSAPRIKDGG